jgi:hypothetical protein
MAERYSFAYLQRPEDNVKMQSLLGRNMSSTRTDTAAENASVDKEEVLTSLEWLQKKFGMLRRETWQDGAEGSWVLTGRRDALPA